MKSVPRFLRGPCRTAMRVALEEIRKRWRRDDMTRQERGWKLFLLLPRMLLHRSPRSRLTPRAKLLDRFEMFIKGRWIDFLTASDECCRQVAASRRRRTRRVEDEMERRVDRVDALVHMGELSSARQALEGATFALGTEATLNALRDPAKRPPEPRAPLPRELVNHEPRALFNLDEVQFGRNLRFAKRGATRGPFRVTVEHLQPLLDAPRDLLAFFHASEQLSRAQVPPSIREAVKLGRLTALQKPNGGVRGIVAGDIVRRLVARTMSQQLMEAVQAATAPFQYAMSTKSGCECIAHALQGLTVMDPRATVMSIDGRNAYDLISRQEMLQGLHDVLRRSSALPFVSTFYGLASSYLWEDEHGHVHTIVQGEGGEQGDAMMPLLFFLGQHTAFVRAQSQMAPGEVLLAFLNDVHTGEAGIRIHQGKTQIWNQAGEKLEGCEELEKVAVFAADPTAAVWRGSDELPPHKRGMKVLGTPVGHADFIRDHLEKTAAEHQVLLDRTPLVEDVQSAWLLLAHCAAAMANYLCRVVEPATVVDFCRTHDERLWRCLCSIVQMPTNNLRKSFRQPPCPSSSVGWD